MRRKPTQKPVKPTREQFELICAIEARDAGKVETLLKAGVSPNSCDEHGTPALNHALYGTRQVKEGDERIALMLLDAGAEPDRADSDGATPIMLACHNGFHDLVERLIGRGVNIQTRSSRGVFAYSGAPLAIAADRGDQKLVRMLIAGGADVNQPIRNQANALTPPAARGDIVMLRDLVAAGAKASGFSLFAPISGKRLDIIKELIAAGADVSVRDRWGNTVLGKAVEEGDAPIVNAIIRAGANLDAVSGGRTPLILAVCKQNKQMLDLLLQAGAKVDGRDIYKFTPLMEAAIRPNKEIMLTLLAAGANPRLKGENGESAIALAKRERMSENVKILEAALKR